MTVANRNSPRNQAVVDRHLKVVRERAANRRERGIEGILRDEVDALVAAANDAPERNPRNSRWSEHRLDWTWAFISRPEFQR